MTIFGLINANSGVSYHRIQTPLMRTPDNVHVYITNNLSQEDLMGASTYKNGEPIQKPDAVYYNRIVNEDIVKQSRAVGAKIVLDIDDYWLLDPHHIAYNDYLTNDFASQQIKHIQQADTITTTHDRLAEKISEYNKAVVITPNAIPLDWYAPATESEYIRLFWQGSITHEKDIELLRGPMRRLGPQFQPVIAGYTEHKAWHRMASAFTSGHRHNAKVLPSAGPEEYYQNYRYADVCLCPLLDTPFNSMKSNLKVLEAAHLGIPVVASYVNPYLGMPVMRVEQQKDWAYWINDLTDPDKRKVRGEYLREWCRERYNFDKINKTRLEALQR